MTVLTRIPEDSLARANRFPPIFLPESRHDAILRRCFRTIVDHKRWRAARRGPVERGWEERGEKKEKNIFKALCSVPCFLPTVLLFPIPPTLRSFQHLQLHPLCACGRTHSPLLPPLSLSLSLYIIKAVSMVSANYRRIKRRN